MIRTSFLLLASLAAVAPALAKEPSSGEQELARMLNGKTQGKAEQCLAPGLGSDPQTVSGIGVVYHAGRTDWVTRFEGGCADLGPFDIIVTVSADNPHCSGQIARIVDSSTGMFRGMCTFGAFVPYTKAK